MKNINIIANPRSKYDKEKAVIRIVVPAPICPPNLSPPVLGHWYCDGFSGHLNFIIGSKSGRYYVRSQLPNFIGDVPRDSELRWWLPASPAELIPPFAFFFEQRGYGGPSLPFLLLSEFDLFAPRPDDWYGLGRFAFIRGRYLLKGLGSSTNWYEVHWEHA